MKVPSDYQVVAKNWLLDHRVSILADAPGVGKTLPAILSATVHAGCKLVVVPAYLISNWVAELEEQGEENVVIATGSRTKRIEAIKSATEWLVLSYESFTIHAAELSKRRWTVVVFDEAHRLKGRDSKRSKAALAFRQSAVSIYLLTGTPLVANGGDLFPLLRLCNPKEFKSYWRFVEEHCKVSMTPWGKKVGKLKDAPKFEAMLKPYMLRRTLESVLPDIPAAVEQDIIVELGSGERRKYELAKTEYLYENPDGKRTRIKAEGLLATVRHLTSASEEKQKALLGLLEDIPEDEQVVVFAWYRATVDLIMQAVPTALGFHGAFSPEERGEIIDAFKDKQSRVLVATLSTMKEGVNLQNARYVIFYEQDWVAATNEQALARLRRRGQEQTVVAYKLIVKRSAEWSVHKAAKGRRAMSLNDIFDEVMNGPD